MKQLISKQYTGSQLLNPQRQYVPAAATNIAETFERIRQQAQQQSRKVRRVK